MGGSHYLRVQGKRGNQPPVLDLEAAPTTLAMMHKAIQAGLITSCHDCSEGGIAVAVAEMAFAGDVGASITIDEIPTSEKLTVIETLFSESLTRFIVEVSPESAADFEETMEGVVCAAIGQTDDLNKFRATNNNDESIIDLPLDELSHVHRTSLTNQLEGDHSG
jgi:phosphoribosylformylglycinamidine synthase